jgi:hypothetical protein
VVNAELEMALTSQTRFTQEEWDRFGIADLRKDDCIESGGAYFFQRLEHKLEFSVTHCIVAWQRCFQTRAQTSSLPLMTGVQVPSEAILI